MSMSAPVGPAPSSGRRFATDEKRWEVAVTEAGVGGRYHHIVATEVRFGDGRITFTRDGDIIAVFNLDYVVSVKTVEGGPAL